MSAFFAMGGYAAYVWPAFGVAIGTLAIAGIIVWHGYRRAQRLLERASRFS